MLAISLTANGQNFERADFQDCCQLGSPGRRGFLVSLDEDYGVAWDGYAFNAWDMLARNKDKRVFGGLTGRTLRWLRDRIAARFRSSCRYNRVLGRWLQSKTVRCPLEIEGVGLNHEYRDLYRRSVGLLSLD